MLYITSFNRLSNALCGSTGDATSRAILEDRPLIPEGLLPEIPGIASCSKIAGTNQVHKKKKLLKL